MLMVAKSEKAIMIKVMRISQGDDSQERRK